MAAIRMFIERYAVATFFVLAFAISWVGILLVVGPGGIPGDGRQLERLGPLVFLAMIAGPSISGILLTIVGGRPGLLGLISRLGRWRFGIRWYAALLIVPLLAAAILSALAFLSTAFVPGILMANDKAALLVLGIVGGLGAGFFEELGWTGFAVRQVRPRYSTLATGVIVGTLWGTWHFLADLWGEAGSYGALFLLHFLVFWVGALSAYRVLMVWVYDRTESLLLAQLMHACFTGSLIVLGPSMASAAQNVLYAAIFAAALWIVVVAIVARSQGRPRTSQSEPPPSLSPGPGHGL